MDEPAAATPTEEPKRISSERMAARPPPSIRSAVRRAPHRLCVALLESSLDQQSLQVEKWLEENFSERLLTKESVIVATNWVLSMKEQILLEAIEDRSHLRSRVDDYNVRVRLAIEKLEKDYLKFASPPIEAEEARSSTVSI
jgi:hypothetical protein